MKRTIILSGVLCLLASTAANAEISVNFGFGEPAPAYIEAPQYAAPAPIYPTYAVEGGRYHERHFHHGYNHRGPVRRGPIHRR